MRKKWISLTAAVLAAVCVLGGCASTVDEPCMYCGNKPSREYEKKDGTPVYVCEECSSTCMLCGREKATKHYDSLLGIVFVCSGCYEKAAGE